MQKNLSNHTSVTIYLKRINAIRSSSDFYYIEKDRNAVMSNLYQAVELTWFITNMFTMKYHQRNKARFLKY